MGHALAEPVIEPAIDRGERLALIQRHVEAYGMGSDVKNIDGYVSRGGEAPFLNPNEVYIVGVDVPATPDNWFAHCPRIGKLTMEYLGDYLADVRKTNQIDDPIDVYKDGTRRLVLEGRRSVMVARMRWAEQVKAHVPEDQRIAVRVITRQGPPEELFRYNSDSHKKVPLTKMEVAQQTLTYHNSVKGDFKKTAEFFDTTEQTIRNKISLFDLSEKMQRRVDAGEIPEAQAAKLAAMPRDKQDSGYEELRAADALTGAAATNGIAALRRGERVTRADKTRSRSRIFLGKVVKELKAREVEVVRVSLPEVIKWFLGGPVPESLSEAATAALVAASERKKG